MTKQAKITPIHKLLLCERGRSSQTLDRARDLDIIQGDEYGLLCDYFNEYVDPQGKTRWRRRSFSAVAKMNDGITEEVQRRIEFALEKIRYWRREMDFPPRDFKV